jgi:anti-sigma regulatory factor (Ser/Thr protein kinase)
MNPVGARIELRIPGNHPESVRLLGVCVRNLALMVFDAPLAAEVELAMVEAVNNSILHAKPGDSDIRLTFTLSSRGVEIDLQDEGRPLDPDILEAAGRKWDFDPTDIQSLPVGGMGLMLIKKVMNEVSYRFENGRNRWRFSKFLPSAASVQSEATRTVNSHS